MRVDQLCLPEIGDEQSEEELTTWQELQGTWQDSSSCVGYLVSLGQWHRKHSGGSIHNGSGCGRLILPSSTDSNGVSMHIFLPGPL